MGTHANYLCKLLAEFNFFKEACLVLLKLAQLLKPTHVNKSGSVYFVVSHLTASCHLVFTIRLNCYSKMLL